MASAKEISFGKRLAALDKPTRDQGVRVLSRWLGKQQRTTELEMMKIWRGLFYCMWLSDKTLVQQELADSLARLLHALPNESATLVFIQAFWQTMEQQWHTLDRLRLDKFYTLLRRFLEQSLRFLQRRSWDADLTARYNQVICACPLRVPADVSAGSATAAHPQQQQQGQQQQQHQPQPSPAAASAVERRPRKKAKQAPTEAATATTTSTAAAGGGVEGGAERGGVEAAAALPGQLGIKLHVISIFLDELGRVASATPDPSSSSSSAAAASLSAVAQQRLLEPFLMLLAHGREPLLFDRVVSLVLEPLIDPAAAAAAAQAATAATAPTPASLLQLDLSALSARLLQIASSPHINERNRSRLYKLRHRVLLSLPPDPLLAATIPRPAASDAPAAAAATDCPPAAEAGSKRKRPTNRQRLKSGSPEQQEQRQQAIGSGTAGSVTSAKAKKQKKTKQTAESGPSEAGGPSGASAELHAKVSQPQQPLVHPRPVTPSSPAAAASARLAPTTTSAKKKVVIALAKNRFQDLDEHYIAAQSESPHLRNMTKQVAGILKKPPAAPALRADGADRRAETPQKTPRKTAKDFF